MESRDHALRVYRELADNFERQQDARLRDLFLMLAADAALRSGWGGEAERLRQRLLSANPHHLLRPYASFAEAASFPDIQKYLEELRRKYPVNVAEEMLNSVVLAPPPQQESDVPGTLPPSPRSPGEGVPGSDEPGTKNIPIWGGGGRRAREEAEPPVIRMHPDLAETQPPPILSGGGDERASRKPPRTSAHPPLDQTLNPHVDPRPAAPAPRGGNVPIDQTLPPKAVPPIPVTRPVQRPIPPAAPPARRSGGVPAPRPAPPAPRPLADPDEEQAWNGAWVPGILFAVVLLAGLALLVTTLAPRLIGIQ